jgi:predicted phage-related endonuclease
MIEEDHAVLEIKTTASFKKKEWGIEGTDQMPLHYLLQCAHYAIIADASYVDLALLIGGNEFRIYRYNRNEVLEKKLIQKATHFWSHHILKQIPPDPLTAQDTARWWPGHKPMDTKVADESLLEKLETFKELKQQIATLTKDHDSLKEDLQLYIGNHELLTDQDHVPLIHYKPLERTTINAQKLKKDHPVIYDLVCKTTLYRRLDLAA